MSNEILHSALVQLHELETLIKYGVSSQDLIKVVGDVSSKLEEYLGYASSDTEYAVDLAKIDKGITEEIKMCKTVYSREYGLGLCIHKNRKTLVMLKGYKIAEPRESLSEKWKSIYNSIRDNGYIDDNGNLTANIACFGFSDTGVLSLMYGYPRSLDIRLLNELYSNL